MANNIAREYIDFSKKNITKYLKIILDKYYAKKIVDPLLEVYINVRYYNNEDIKYKNFTSNINYYLRQKAIEMKENAKKPRKLSKFQQRYEEMMKQREQMARKR